MPVEDGGDGDLGPAELLGDVFEGEALGGLGREETG